MDLPILVETPANDILNRVQIKPVKVVVPSNDPNELTNLNIHINRRCNVKCQMCGHWRDTEANRKELPYEKVIELINDGIEIGCKQVIFNGGEPTLRKDLMEMIRYASKLGLKTELRTNGSLFKQDYCIELVDAGINEISMSFDSPVEKIHDAIRGCPGLYKKMTQGLQTIKNMNSNIVIRTNCTVMNNNYRELDEMIPFCVENGIHCCALQLVRSHSSFAEYRFVEESGLRLNKEQLEEFYHEVGSRFFAQPGSVLRSIQPMFLELTMIETQYDLMSEALKDREKYKSYIQDYSNELYGKQFVERSFCTKPLNRAEISAEGNLYTCCSVNAKELTMGNVYEQSLKDIWRSEAYTKLRYAKKSPRDKVCLTCPSYRGIKQLVK